MRGLTLTDTPTDDNIAFLAFFLGVGVGVGVGVGAGVGVAETAFLDLKIWFLLLPWLALLPFSVFFVKKAEANFPTSPVEWDALAILGLSRINA